MRKSVLFCVAILLAMALPTDVAAGGVRIESHGYTAPAGGLYYHGKHGGVVLSAPRYSSHRVIRHYSFPPGTYYRERRHYAPSYPYWAPRAFGHHPRHGGHHRHDRHHRHGHDRHRRHGHGRRHRRSHW